VQVRWLTASLSLRIWCLPLPTPSLPCKQ